MFKKNNTVEYLLNYSNEYFFNELGVTKWEYINRYKDYIIKQDNEYFFRKRIIDVFLYNEIIGRFLCRKINLDTTDLIIDKKGFFSNIMLTPNYHSKDYDYYRPRDNFDEEMEVRCFNDICFEKLEKPLKDDILKLIALDMMMEQIDRYSRNMEIAIINNNERLAPIIDFELAFNNNRNYIYFNPYIIIRKNIRSLDAFYNKYSEGYKYLEEMFKVSASELFDYVLEDYELDAKKLVKKDIYRTVKRNHDIVRELNGRN